MLLWRNTEPPVKPKADMSKLKWPKTAWRSLESKILVVRCKSLSSCTTSNVRSVSRLILSNTKNSTSIGIGSCNRLSKMTKMRSWAWKRSTLLSWSETDKV